MMFRINAIQRGNATATLATLIFVALTFPAWAAHKANHNPGGNSPVGTTLSTLDCTTEGDVAVWDGSAWVCASSLPAPDRFVDNGDGTITDNQTGLMWEQKLADTDAQCLDADQANRDVRCVQNTYTWAATGCCNQDGDLFTDFLWNLNDLVDPNDGGATTCHAGYCDWRLPTVSELRSIVRAESPFCIVNAISPCIAEGFPGPTAVGVFPTQPNWYFTSQSAEIGIARGWHIVFDFGTVLNGNLGNGYVRAVRDSR